jgi:hypothetical protein
MTASPSSPPESKSPSRRALLAGALGGLGALAASAIGRASPVRAGVDGDVVLGVGNAATTPTSITNSTNSNAVFQATSTSAGTGVHATSASGAAVFAESFDYIAVSAYSSAASSPAILGQAAGGSTAIQGYSGSGGPPAATAKTGVYGYAAQDSTSRGVHGESPTGWAGYFAGRVYVSRYHEMPEITTPSAPGANKARLFVRDNGGFTQLCVRFNTGGVKVLATQT